MCLDECVLLFHVAVERCGAGAFKGCQGMACTGQCLCWGQNDGCAEEWGNHTQDLARMATVDERRATEAGVEESPANHRRGLLWSHFSTAQDRGNEQMEALMLSPPPGRAVYKASFPSRIKFKQFSPCRNSRPCPSSTPPSRPPTLCLILQIST